MKKIFTLAIASLALLSTNAQTRLGLKAGYSFTDVNPGAKKGYSFGLEHSGISTFHAGIVADIALGKHFALQPGVLYAPRGFDQDGYIPGPADGPEEMDAKVRYHYLEMPVNFLYKHTWGPGRLFVGAGPFLAYGIKGSVDATHMKTYHLKETVVFMNKPRSYQSIMAQKRYLKPFNAGAGLMLGYECFSGMTLSANYNIGLTNLEPEGYISQRSRALYVSVGYFF